MDKRRIALSAVVALGIAAAPLSGAEAHRHHTFPLLLPFVAAGAVVGTAAAIAAAPFTAPAPYYYGYSAPAPAYYAPPPAYYAPGYYQPGYYPGY